MKQYIDFCRETWGYVHDSYILSDPVQYDKWKHTLLRKNYGGHLGLVIRPKDR